MLLEHRILMKVFLQAKKGRDEEVQVVLQKLRGKGNDILFEARAIKVSNHINYYKKICLTYSQIHFIDYSSTPKFLVLRKCSYIFRTFVDFGRSFKAKFKYQHAQSFPKEICSSTYSKKICFYSFKNIFQRLDITSAKLFLKNVRETFLKFVWIRLIMFRSAQV